MRGLLSVGPNVSLVLALLLGAFCYWGLFTGSGQRQFDEMDGLIPFYAGILAIVALLLFAAGKTLRWLTRR